MTPVGDARTDLLDHERMLDLPEAGAYVAFDRQLVTGFTKRTISAIATCSTSRTVGIEYDIPLVMALSDRVIAMASGRIIATGTPDAIRLDSAVIESYLGGDLQAIERSGATVR